MTRAKATGVVLLALVALLVVVPATPSAAAEITYPHTVPGVSGTFGGICNVDMHDADGGTAQWGPTAGFTVRLACQVGQASGTPTATGNLKVVIPAASPAKYAVYGCISLAGGVCSGGDAATWTTGTIDSFIASGNAARFRATINFGVRNTFSNAADCSAGSPSWGYTQAVTQCPNFDWSRYSAYNGLAGSFANGQSLYFDTKTMTGSNPVMPSDYFTGGSEEVSYIDPPAYDCGRIMNDAGATRHFVDLKAIGPNNPQTGAEDYDQLWVVEWDGWVEHHGQEVELLTPPAYEAPEGGWIAIFEAKRRIVPTPGYQAAPPSGIDWTAYGHSPDYDAPWIVDPLGALSEWGDRVDDAIRDLLAPVRGMLFSNDEEPVQLATGGGDWDAADEWDSVIVHCTVLIDPNDTSEDAPYSWGYVGPTTGGGTNPNAPPGEGSSSCSAPSGWDMANPLEWFGFAACSGLKALAGILQEILGVLKGLWGFFVPPAGVFDGLWDDLGESFPFSLATEVVDLFTGVLGSIEPGDPCVVIDVSDIVDESLDDVGGGSSGMAFPLPTPASAGCAGSGEMSGPIGQVADLFGHRDVFRQVMVVLMYVGLVLGAIKAFVDEDDDQLAPQGAGL